MWPFLGVMAGSITGGATGGASLRPLAAGVEPRGGIFGLAQHVFVGDDLVLEAERSPVPALQGRDRDGVFAMPRQQVRQGGQDRLAYLLAVPAIVFDGFDPFGDLLSGCPGFHALLAWRRPTGA